ncbi:hypothetical protein HDU86_004493 [Geranomyces michiganensis]|nr:hypothetical protein HDU86_004493 [Geranomyces michiganensis]
MTTRVLTVTPLSAAECTITGQVRIDLLRAIFGGTTLHVQILKVPAPVKQKWHTTATARSRRPSFVQSEAVWRQTVNAANQTKMDAGLHVIGFRITVPANWTARRQDGEHYVLRPRLERRWAAQDWRGTDFWSMDPDMVDALGEIEFLHKFCDSSAARTSLEATTSNREVKSESGEPVRTLIAAPPPPPPYTPSWTEAHDIDPDDPIGSLLRLGTHPGAQPITARLADA